MAGQGCAGGRTIETLTGWYLALQQYVNDNMAAFVDRWVGVYDWRRQLYGVPQGTNLHDPEVSAGLHRAHARVSGQDSECSSSSLAFPLGISSVVGCYVSVGLPYILVRQWGSSCEPVDRNSDWGVWLLGLGPSYADRKSVV